MTTQNSTLALIDLSSIFFPAFYSVGNDPNPNAAILSSFRRVMQLATKWPHVAICADSGRSFRADISPSYKAQRKERDAVLTKQLDMLIAQLVDEGFPVLRARGFEADDIIASAALQAYTEGHRVIIATADKDLNQLIDDHAGVSVWSLTKDVEANAALVFQKFGVHPSQMRDYLTLCGDASDNIAGVRGVGDKTAAKILATFGTLDAALASIQRGDSNLTAGVLKSFAESAANIPIARELVTLHTDAPIDISAAFLPRVTTTRPKPEDAMPEDVDAMEVEPVEVLPAPQPATAAPVTALATKADIGQDSAQVTRMQLVEPAASSVPFDRQLEPRSINAANAVAKWIFESNLYRQFDSPQAVFSVLLAGRELNLPAMASLRGFHVVEGRPTIAADLLRSLVLASGKAEYFLCAERTAERSTWRTKRIGDPDPVTLTYTMDEAKAANLPRPNSGWAKHPADMIAKTASTKLARLVYPDVTFGLYAPEELGGES